MADYGRLLGGFIYYAVRREHRRDREFQRTHLAPKKEMDKLGRHHKEDQLNIETAKFIQKVS